ncbi:IS66 family transposase [Chitinophaga filiformis]|uniref:Transposase n=1 Tax=Chitinophaga filiformis TaxID=104663 RepID=A0A1G8EDF9_CHIFI|nr:IS66 family transposase [Chitinophaga filiformis]SDH67908.1 Transposase [Chitinophaga filiformis]
MQSNPNIDYKQRYEQAEQTIGQLKHELAVLKKMIFGSRHEKFISNDVPPQQLSLDIQPEQTLASSVITAQRITYTRSRVNTEPPSHPGRNKLPDHLRREEIIIEPAHIPPGSKKIGQLETEVLEYKAAELYVKKYIRYKYLAPESDATASNIITAPLPNMPLPKCIAGSSLLAQMIIDKFVDHLPLHRQMQRFERAGVKFPYSTLTDWVSAAANLITPLYESLVSHVLSVDYIQCDETPMPVLDKDKKGKTHRGFFWAYQDSINKLVVFDYQEGRNKEGPAKMLATYKGTIQTDGYLVYDTIAEGSGITLIHCMAHARRYFIDALDHDRNRAEHALQQIQLLYEIEQHCTSQQFDYNARKDYRLKKAVPVLSALGIWMTEQYAQVLPKSPIGQALAYSIKRWAKLSLYARTGNLLPDNNLIENSIRPIALGRKNHLFAGSHEAAKRSAMLYSLLGTCKMHRINPIEWLADVLAIVAEYPVNKIKDLLPHNWKPTQN